MKIPAHRAAAVVPTPARTLIHDGKGLTDPAAEATAGPSPAKPRKPTNVSDAGLSPAKAG